MRVKIKLEPRTGDRIDASVRVIGPGETDYTFPLSVTATLQAIWGLGDDQVAEALKDLVYEMFSSIVGTASAPPKNGYWFDSYNSETTIKATLNRMRNLGQVPFLKNPTTKDQTSSIFGGGILTDLEDLDATIFQKTGLRLLNALDYAFERSEAEHDLSTPPADNAGFLYRICILSVIIDAFSVRRTNENKYTPSLKAITNWLEEKVGREEALGITEAFARVKDLRKQYPIHEHFVVGSTGQRAIRNEVEEAESFFGFQSHYDVATKWKAVTDAFKDALIKLKAVIETNN